MGNQHEIQQVSPREGFGAVIRVRPSHAHEVRRLLDEARDRGTFYTLFRPAGEPIDFPNLDGPYVILGPQQSDHVIIQSGGKMWCGYEAFVDHVRMLAPHLEDTLFFVGDEEYYIDEFRLSGGQLHYHRVHQGYGWPVADYLRHRGVPSVADQIAAPDPAPSG
ncbi:MAG TPA: hypothetical protein VKU00_23915 [Chthonomonadaceae bacterium]|nr:hypothetical protein [Chthonomonadaceae bacterium]